MNEPVSVAIAGLGRSGWDIHARLLAPMTDQYRIVAVLDADDGRRREAVDRFGCATYTDYEALLADPRAEVVVVALPSHLHADAAIAALAAGKHVVCEKPMAPTLADADRMVAAAAASDKVLTIFQQRRYNPDFVQVKAVIDSGVLGRIVQINLAESGFSRRWDWQMLQKFGGGTLNNTGAHFLDQALQLFGPAAPHPIFCHMERTLTLGDAEDYVKLLFRGAGAPVVDIEINSCSAYPPETWKVLGTRGGLAGTTQQLRWRWVVDDELPPRTLDLAPTPDRSYNRDALTWHEESWTQTISHEEAYRGFYRDLHATLRQGAPLAITPQSVRRVIWLQEECHRLAPLAQIYG